MSNTNEYNHPQRYTGKDGKDLIDRLEEGMISKEQVRGFLKGNILKYVTRYESKDGTKDLLKAKKKRGNEKFITIEIELLPKRISKEQARGFLKGNILKYVTRYESKDGIKDLLKAKVYLKRLIAFEEAEKGTMRKY